MSHLHRSASLFSAKDRCMNGLWNLCVILATTAILSVAALLVGILAHGLWGILRYGWSLVA